MTYFLVLAIIVLVALGEGYSWHRRTRLARAAQRAVQFDREASSSRIPPDVLFHPGHTWVRIHDKGLASVGITPFASSFAGELALVRLPEEGKRLRQAEPACTLVSTRNRWLELVMPIEGEVLAVNHELLRDPSLAQRRPYDEGWILRVRPRQLRNTLRNLMPAKTAQTWFDAARALVAARMEPAVGTLLNDGGELMTGFGERLSDETWDAIKSELFAIGEAPERRLPGAAPARN